jgi:Tfp pilus assembly protein PilZ
MEYDEDYPHRNDIILQLIKRILDMTDGERLDLLEQLNKLPVQELSLGERDGARRMYDQTITFSTQDRQYKALCKDISNGGIFIQTAEMFQLGQMVTLDIPFSDGKESIKVPAEIVRINPDGIGLKFMKKENGTYL